MKIVETVFGKSHKEQEKRLEKVLDKQRRAVAEARTEIRLAGEKTIKNFLENREGNGYG